MHERGKLAKGSKLAAAFLFFAACTVLCLPFFQSHEKMYIEKLDQIPDFKQTEKELGFPDQGRDFCAPVAVADTFAYMSEHGYRELLLKEDRNSKTVMPIASCRKLAELMKTRPIQGTSSEDFLNGLKAYIEQCSGYKIKELKYHGWNRHPSEFDEHAEIPDLAFLKNSIRNNRYAWLNIGWYKENQQKHELERQSGHWLTLVAYGLDYNGLSEENTLIVRDPNPVQGRSPRNIFIKVEELKGGRLSGPHQGLPRSARNYLRVVKMGNLTDTSQNRIGIIDGAVVLELWPSPL
ncbi:MAG: hypothetical protein K2X27_21390 [Candidatus Obscuribacterales bacterium]|nr:hypothetical protein [Candidatus Obscuribacterales bacterium]